MGESDLSKTCPRKVALAREPMLCFDLPGFAFWSSPGVEPGVAEGTSALVSLLSTVGGPCSPVGGAGLSITCISLTVDIETVCFNWILLQRKNFVVPVP
jgi:hypothetical protein